MQKLLRLKFLRQKNKPDLWLLILTIIFTIFGLIMVYESSNVAAFQSFGNKYYFAKDQFLWGLLGFFLIFLTQLFHFKKFFSLSVPLLAVTLLSLVAVFIPGVGIKAFGARRWLDLGVISFQPSELAKISLILYLSAWLSSKEKGRFLSFLFLLGLIVGLVILQPDLGTAVILTSIFLMVYFISRAPLWHFLILIPVTLIAILIMAYISPYRYQRLITYLNVNSDPLGASYHIRQILISLGSGGLTGLGLGASRQKYQYLPEATTDSIFAIIAEEFGFVGTTAIIIAYLIFLFRIFRIVKNAPDKFSYLLSGGIFALFGFQIIINLGAMVAILPLTGIPLPFISYGGSNLVISLTSVGLLLNISKHAIHRR